MSLGGPASFGWYAYSPLTAVLQAPATGVPGWLRLIIWLGLIGVWALASIKVLRPSSSQAPPPTGSSPGEV